MVAAAVLPGHLGLVSMRERARAAGGWLNLSSTPGEGTTVEFWIPDSPALEEA
jgi:signal transduction histidine kinase